MANTFVQIASATTTAGTSTVTFSAIPQTFDDLLVCASTRLAWAGGGSPDGQFISISLNTAGNDSFFRAYVLGNGPTGTNGTSPNVIYVNDSNTSANTFTSWSYYIHDYINTSYGKMTQADVTLEGITADTMPSIAGQITSVTSAITSLIFYSTIDGNFAADSTFYLYGIKRN